METATHRIVTCSSCLCHGNLVLSIIAVALLILSGSAKLPAQDLNLSFHHLTQDEGLSQGINAYVYEDSRGFIWISSIYGLNRYDGKTVKTYMPDPEDSLALAGGLINSNFFEDESGDIWFTSNVAIQRYIRKKDHFETIRLYKAPDSLISADIMAFHLDKQQNLWLRAGVLSKGMLHLYQTQSRKDSILYPLDGQRCKVLTDPEGNVTTVVSSMFLEKWGFEIIDHQTQERKRLMSKAGADSLLTQEIYIENSESIWFGSSKGLLHFNPAAQQYQFFDQFENQSIGRVWQAIPWKDKLLVSSGLLGILVFDLREQRFVQALPSEQGVTGSLRQDNVYELYIDNHDILWVSLWSIGLDYASLNKVKFKSPFPPEHQSILSMVEGPDGDIWYTTRSGIKAISRDHESIPIKLPIKGWDSSRQHNHIPMLFKDRMQRIWMNIGTDVFLYDRKAFHLTCTLADPPRDIISLSNGRILISTNLTMFELIDSASAIIVKIPEEFKRYGETSFETMYEDVDGHFYVSRNSQSLLVFQSSHGKLSEIGEINGTGDCKAFLRQEDSDSLLICTERGVMILDPRTLGNRVLRKHPDGLPAELYYSMIPDTKGNIWLSGNKGIVRYHPVSHTYQRYSRADGLPSVEFNTDAYHKNSTGEIWFGSANGITVFNPLQVVNIAHLPQMQITGLLVNDEPYASDLYIGEDTAALTFDYDHNTLSFEFVALEFSDPKAIQHKYRLLGFDDTWVESGTRSFARYPGLPPGDYEFEVIASNSDGVWNTSNPRTLKVSIKPPFTQTFWFYLLLALAAGSLAYLLYRLQLKRKLEIAEKKRLLELDELKNRLYTNITHEFRTPLTLIHGPISHALSTETTLEKKDLKSIYRQSERLQQLINQMLDLQKVEAGKLKPHFDHGDIVQLIRYLVGSFETWAKEKSVLLVFSSSVEELQMDFDEEKVTQIVSNLISNAIRHTMKSGKVSVNTSQTGDKLHIRVQDTGVGISPEDLPKIFDRYYQSSRAAVGGTGIGLALTKNLVELLGGSIAVESTLDFGTTFDVALPITSHAQKTVPATKRMVEHVLSGTDDDETRFLPTDTVISEKPLVLIVEDHPEVSQYVASCLAKDFITLTAMDGNDGIKKAFEHTPDLIVSDIMMPGKDGFELCSTLKTNIQTSHIPIILLTGRGDQAALMSGIEHGADAYVVKPFDPQELLLRVKKLLELRANLSQYYRKPSTSEDLRSTVQASAKENEFLTVIRSCVEEHMSDAQFNMQMLSQRMAMSHSQLHRKVTALTGESVGKFVRGVRLSKARDLLTHSDLAISEIAYETGFSDPGYFTRVFSKEYNMTPSEYRSTLS